jgi:hypothetical protein
VLALDQPQLCSILGGSLRLVAWLLCRLSLTLLAIPAPLVRLLMETLRISMLGTNRKPLEELIAEAASAYNASQACRTAVHSVDQV